MLDNGPKGRKADGPPGGSTGDVVGWPPSPDCIPLDINLRNLSPEDWRARIDAIGEEHGYFLPVGSDHSALFIDAGPRLLVTFEEADAIRTGPGGRPAGFDLVETEGWSLLTIIAEGRTWFRSDALTWFFDRQVDDGFFEDFDRILFYGEHMGGYAAGAYSVTAPGAHVLLLRPVASLDPAVAGWDRRDRRARRLDFTTRYGYAPDMVEAAMKGWVVADPLHPTDAMHAALFRRPNMTLLRAPLASNKLVQFLGLMEAKNALFAAAMQGTLDRAEWGRLWRGRRALAPYPRSLLKRAEAEGRMGLAARICAWAQGTPDAAYFTDRARDLALPMASRRPVLETG